MCIIIIYATMNKKIDLNLFDKKKYNYIILYKIMILFSFYQIKNVYFKAWCLYFYLNRIFFRLQTIIKPIIFRNNFGLNNKINEKISSEILYHISK